MKEFYAKYPDMLIENFLECELYWYQKVLLRLLLRNTKPIKKKENKYEQR